MKVARFLITVVMAGLMVPILGAVLQEGTIGARNGHWFGWMATLAHSVSFLPLSLLASPINVTSALIVAAFSSGLEQLIRRRSVLIWVGHGSAMGILQLVWIAPFSRPWLIVLGVVGSWVLAALGMWSVLSRGQAVEEEFPRV